MHAAMNCDAGHTIMMGFGDPLNEGIVFHATEAFIVEDDVIALCPVILLIDADLVIPGRPAFVNDAPIDIGALTDTCAENELLLVVVMAAATGDHERFDWSLFCSC